MTDQRVTPPAELALAFVGLTVVAAFGRVFESGFVVPLTATLAAVLGTTALARRLGWHLPAAAATTAVVVGLVLSWTVLWETTLAGVPTPTTLEAAGDSFSEGWRAFRDVVAPSPPLPGLVLSAAIALSFALFLADWAAFRLWSPFEALIAPFALVVFCIMLGDDGRPLTDVALFAGAVLVFLLTHRMARSGGRADRSVALAGLGSAMVVIAVVAGTFLGPMLPGAGDEALLEWRGDRSTGGQRTTISPLVDIRNRITSRSDVDVFQVRSDQRSYWRLTALDTYSDGVWRSSGRYRAVDGALPDSTPPGDATEIHQTVTIQTLEAIWLPAAFQPVAVEADQKVRWKADSSTLIVDSTLPSSDGMVYEVRSSRPVTPPDQLRGFDGTIPDGFDEELVGIPTRDESLVGDLVREVTAGQTNAYDQLIALQNWFRTDFDYDLSVPPGHGADAIASFLEARRGYCEQFAGTFAVMARSLGYPARVAVGFTTGDQMSSDPTLFQVRGEHAHAWPEVWMGEANGWVSFEPTPGRGAPGAEHTGVPEEQDTSGPANAPTTTDTTAGSGATSPTDLTGSPSTQAPATGQGEPAATPEAATADGSDGILVVAALVALATTAYLLGVPLLLELRRRRRRRRATNPRDRVEVAWSEALEAFAGVGVAHSGRETNLEYVERLSYGSSDLDAEATRLRELAATTDEARFGAVEVTDDAAASAEAGAEQITRSLRERRTIRQRATTALDPRPLLRRRSRRHTLGPDQRP